jgi:hypothetical protein
MFVGVDHEYISDDALQGSTPGQRPDVRSTYCEVMQVGACKVDAQGNEIGVLNIVVRAHRIHTIPAWLTAMTGMTAERRAVSGVPFGDALRQLEEFCRGSRIFTFNGDFHVIDSNCRAHGIPNPFLDNPFVRVKPLIARLPHLQLEDFVAHGMREICSGGLYLVLGITLPAIQGVGAHDAAHDARSLIYAVRHLDLLECDPEEEDVGATEFMRAVHEVERSSTLAIHEGVIVDGTTMRLAHPRLVPTVAWKFTVSSDLIVIDAPSLYAINSARCKHDDYFGLLI